MVAESGPRHKANPAQRLAVLGLSLCFVAGFSTVFIALGAGASAVGQLLLRYKYEANMVGGIIVIIFGLFMLGMLKLDWLHRDLRFHGNIKGARPIGAQLIGLAFAFG
ncbi:MAG: cytochrome c biogenesis protein CcdA [Sulfuricaulis sp.]|nr:cytochrome c biogenesis protein CcdA [Sulfuricaulis sp.]